MSTEQRASRTSSSRKKTVIRSEPEDAHLGNDGNEGKEEESGQDANLVDRLGELPKDLEVMLGGKEPRLPKGIRAYIRALKQSSNFEQAMQVRDEAVREKITTKRGKAVFELNQTIRNIIETDDPLAQAESEVRAIWLMSSLNILNSDERVQNILEVLDSKETELKEQLEGNLPAIRKEVERILVAYKR